MGITWYCQEWVCAPPWRDGDAGGCAVPFCYSLEAMEEERTEETDLQAPAQCARHPRNKHASVRKTERSYNWHVPSPKSDTKTKITLMPRRETNASWPGLRAITSPSTNRLTGRLTNCSSRYVQCKDQDDEQGVYKSGYREAAHPTGCPPIPSKWSVKENHVTTSSGYSITDCETVEWFLTVQIGYDGLQSPQHFALLQSLLTSYEEEVEQQQEKQRSCIHQFYAFTDQTQHGQL